VWIASEQQSADQLVDEKQRLAKEAIRLSSKAGIHFGSLTAEIIRKYTKSIQIIQ
jgi:hypothetical protein